MFVLPPPPRYPTQAAYNAAVAAGHATLIETNNILSHPEDQFVAGEGTYVLKEDLHLATPPPHPSEAPIVNPNPLATNPQPATAGTRISLLRFGLQTPPAAFFHLTSSTTLSTSIAEHPSESRSSNDAKLSSDEGHATSISDGPPTSMTAYSTPAFGEGNALLAPERLKDANKRRKPKNNITKSNSSFISRAIINESSSKKLADRPGDALFAFANINRAFQWLDLSSPTKADYLTKILFTKAHCLSHDVNQLTKSPGHIDIIMGFSTGEIIWWEPVSQRYSRLNKNGMINKTPVSQIRWIPGSEHLFMAAHMDGSIVVYDKEKEDAPFHSEEEEPESNGEDGASTIRVDHTKRIQVIKSVYSKNQKTNPVAVWKLSNQVINAFAISPDNRHLAVVSEDSTMRIIDYLKEEYVPPQGQNNGLPTVADEKRRDNRLLGLFYGYYGGLSCVCWSPDGKYVVTGGQDDLISIWCPSEGTLIARCQGHQSWVTAVAFDPWRCDDRNYRFGSVGEDCRLCLWDFNVGMIHKPKAASVRHRGSVSSRITAGLQRAETSGTIGTTTSRLRSNSADVPDGEDGNVIEHPVEPRSRVAILPAVLTKQADKDPLCWLEFTEDAILTSCKSGHIRTWTRPTDLPTQPDKE